MAIITINDKEYYSYATVQDADDYFNAKFGSEWSGIDQDDKKKLLISATREMEKLCYQGHKVDEEQPLKFPRQICCKVIAEDDYRLIECCCEIANAIYLTSCSDCVNMSIPNADKIKSMSVGDTSISFQENASIETDVFDAMAMPIIKKYLRCFLKGNVIVY